MASAKAKTNQNLKKMVSQAGRQVAGARTKKKVGSAKLSPAVSKKIRAELDKSGRLIQKIPLDLIHLDENVRTRYDDKKLQILANSLREDGLIQFPTLCLRKLGSSYELVCKNGHRRILAAKLLGWSKIDSIIVPFDSEREELYHTINANLRENVFYLDIAIAYQDAARIGEKDATIAERVGVNVRTVGWYRRLTKMSPTCQRLCKQHSDLFTATWAVKLARQGELPSARKLEAMMRQMVKEGRAWVNQKELSKEVVGVSAEHKKKAFNKVHRMFSGRQGADNIEFTTGLLESLTEAGYLSKVAYKKISTEFLHSKKTKSSVQKHIKKASSKRK